MYCVDPLMYRFDDMNVLVLAVLPQKAEPSPTCKAFELLLQLAFGVTAKPRLLPSNTSALPLVATLLPFKYNTPLAVPPEKVGLLVRVVMLAEVAIRLVIVADAARNTVAETSEQVRLEGFVPSSITALAEVME